MTDSDKRIEKLERTVDILRFHLLNTLEQSYALAAELAELKDRKQSEDSICTKILQEFNTLSTLNPVHRKEKSWCLAHINFL